MDVTSRTSQEQALLEGLEPKLKQILLEEAPVLAKLLASLKDEELLGRGEFQLRDEVHRIAARALEATLQERKKGGTKGPA